MKSLNFFLNIKILLFLSFILILLTNNYFSFEDSIYLGARDGADYFLIANGLESIPPETLHYQKAWRFIIPLFAGIIGDIFNIDKYFVFRFLTILFCLSCIILFYLILKKFKFNDFHIFFLSSFLIFNPYLFRYFLALPTMLNDLIFINAGLVFVLGILNKNKYFLYFGFCLSLISRQNSIFLLISVIITKFFFKKNSIIKIKDIIIMLILMIIFFSINYKFASYYAFSNDAYTFSKRFNIFLLDYNLIDFIKYNLFPLIILLPLIIYLLIEKNTLDFSKINIEFFFIIFLVSIFIFTIAYVGGPVITGKNLIRLINLAFPLIILSLIIPFRLNENNVFSFKFIFYLIIFFLWSLHPTFSNIKLFSFLLI